jgi:hypothetical protein
MRRASSRRFIARASPHIHVRVHLLSVLAVCGPCPSSLPAAESILAQIPRSLGAIILQAAWDCCGIWPSPSRAHADPARFVAAHDPPRLLATPSPRAPGALPPCLRLARLRLASRHFSSSALPALVVPTSSLLRPACLPPRERLDQILTTDCCDTIMSAASLEHRVREATSLASRWPRPLVTMPVHRSRCPAAFPHAARVFSPLHRTRLAAHSRPRPLAIGSCCLRSLPLPAAESVLAQIPRSLGAIILQAAWDCCGIWPSPSRARPPSCPSTPATRIHAARLCCAMASLCCLSLCLSMPHGMLSMPVECCSHVLSPSFWAVLRASRRRLIRLDRLRARVPELGS